MTPEPPEPPEPPVPPGLVWYVGYGSNLSAARFATYLDGGRPVGGSLDHVGARDRRRPRRDVAVDLPGSVYFAGDSAQWGGGGIAFYDHDVPGPAAGRAYLLTLGQLVDVARQEMHHPRLADDPLEVVLAAPLEHGRHEVGPGRYETLLEVGRLEGLPLLTFTTAGGSRAVPHTVPSAAYVETLVVGLRESRGWDRARSLAYLRAAAPPATGGPLSG